MIFPLAYLVLTSGLTLVLIAVGLAGQSTLAAELAVIQGALLATFYAFSANTRSLILQGHGNLTPDRLLAKRVIALPLLGIASYFLCVQAAGVSPVLALLLILRRSLEWLAEVRLCEVEVAGDRRHAIRAAAVQVGITVVVAALAVFAPEAITLAFALFALAPLLSSPPRFAREAFTPGALRLTFRGAAPHIGSTAVEGISTYVLRLVVFVIAGREMAGLLFTAFVLGSFLATLFANVVGPTMALQRARQPAAMRLLGGRWIPYGLAGAGAVVAATSAAAGLPALLGKPGYFWLALGLSLLGGAVMIAAQAARLRLFDERRAEVLFGPDVLRNLCSILAVPTFYYLVSPTALAALYLVTAVLTLFFYQGAARDRSFREPERGAWWLSAALAAVVLLPVFFFLDGRLYSSPEAPLLDTGGSVMAVPFPVSIAACFAGVLLLARYRHATLAFTVIFLMFVAMVFTSVVITHGDVARETRKFLLLFQYLIPASALVLGQMVGGVRQAARAVGTAFCVVLALIVPVQLLRSIGYGESELYHDVVLFSIYQHLQYVPSVFVCAYLYALLAFWDSSWRRSLVIVAPLVGWYVAASYSSLAIGLLCASALLLAVLRGREAAARWCAVLTIVGVAAPLFLARQTSHVWQRFETTTSATEYRLAAGPKVDAPRRLTDALPGPVQARLGYWTLFGKGIVESGESLLFGHPQAVDRKVAPSAHNYYLDFVYNFGVMAFLPLAWLMGYTLLLLWRARGFVRNLPLLGAAIAVLFVLALDNMFKVPLRQPYPGIFFFFLWGLLLAQLRPARAPG